MYFHFVTEASLQEITRYGTAELHSKHIFSFLLGIAKLFSKRVATVLFPPEMHKSVCFCSI